MSIVNVSLRLEVINCWVCGCTFAMSSSYTENLRNKGTTFFCPKGCRLAFGEPEWKGKLARALESEKYYKHRSSENLERAEKTQRQLTATRGVVTRIKNRISNGVCPCCNHQFKDLQQHMAKKHPDFVNHEAP